MMTPPPRFRQDDQGDGHAGLDGDLFRHRPGPPARGAHAPSAFSTVTLLSEAALYGGRRALDGRNRRVPARVVWPGSLGESRSGIDASELMWDFFGLVGGGRHNVTAPVV